MKYVFAAWAAAALVALTPSISLAAPQAPLARPTTPPARICGNSSVLRGPSKAPEGAITIPAGDNKGLFKAGAGKTYWLAPGVHTLGTGVYDQVQPEDNTTFIGAPGAILDGRNKNYYAFTTPAKNVRISYLTIRNFNSFRDQGVVNHDSGSGWTISNNTVVNNHGAGVFIGSDNTVAYNCLQTNGQYGFSAFGVNGVQNIVLDHNEIVGNDTDDWEHTLPNGCGCTGGGKFWNTTGATVTSNWVHDNKSVGLWADTNDVDFRFEGNYIENNDAEALFYEISYNALILNNTFLRNTLVKGKSFAAAGDSFPIGTIYLSESGGDARVADEFAVLRIEGNYFENNWGGVTLWENADRFCNSPANTSSGFCTKLPGITIAHCMPSTIGRQINYNGCRWKTKNVLVQNNEFHLDKSAIGCTGDYCARNSILSNFGTYPDWSPYKGAVIEDAITFHQNNVFRANTYVGDWVFMPHDTGATIGFDAWRAAPYYQDAGSTKN